VFTRSTNRRFQASKREFSASDLRCEFGTSCRIVNLHQLISVADGVGSFRDKRTNIRWCCDKAEAILNVALVFTELVGEFSDAVTELARHTREDRRLIEWREILTLKVLNDGNLNRLLIAHLFNDRGDHGEGEGGYGAPTAFAGDDLVVSTVKWANEDWLEDAMLSNARCKVV
jgi:hypothetical protein